MYTLSLPSLGLEPTTAPLALVKQHHHYYKVLYYPHTQICGGQLPTPVMKARQHPWAQWRRKSTVLDEDLWQTSHVCTSEWPSLLAADITDCTTSPTNKPVHNVSGPGKVF